MSQCLKLSAPATKEFWEIPILYEDEHLLALDKPGRLLTSPDRYDRARPNLMKLLHRDIERGATWARERRITYLANAHRLDYETSGVILLAKDKPTLVRVVDLFGSEKLTKTYVAIAHGHPPQDRFEANFKLAPHPVKIGLMRVDEKNGKQSCTQFEVLERFDGYSLLQCRLLTGRTHQIRVHLQRLRLCIVADTLYSGKPLFLSSLKRDYRFKDGEAEKPLISRVALHAVTLDLAHPVTHTPLHIEAAWPKDLTVAVKYLRRFAPNGR